MLGYRKLMETYRKTDGHCAYCGIGLPVEAFTVEHMVPTARGGSDDLSNLVPACTRCNTSKRALTVDEFRHHIFGAIARELESNALARLHHYRGTLTDAEAVDLELKLRTVIETIDGLAPVFHFEQPVLPGAS